MEHFKLQKKSLKLILPAAILGIIILHFQNCGEAFVAHYNEEFAQLSSIAPEIVLEQNPPAVTNNRSFEIQFDIKANKFASIETITCQLDNGAPEPCRDRYSVSDLADGDHVLRIVAKDTLGNISEFTPLFFKVDGTKPVVVINSSPAAVSGQATANFTFTATDNFSGVAATECSFDNAAFAACTSPVTYNGLTEKSYSFKVRARDTAGNVSDEVSYEWRVDLTAPVITIDSGPMNTTNSPTATFTFSGTDEGQALTNFECSIDNGNFEPCTSPHTYSNLADGSHEFQVRGRDLAGNLSAEVTRRWTIDTVPPILQIINAPFEISYYSGAVFQFSVIEARGLSRIECSLDGSAYTRCDSPVSYSGLPDGMRTFSARAIDSAGNISTVATYRWTIDSVPPQVSLTSSVPRNTTSTSATMTFSATDNGGTGVASYECRLDNGAFAPCTSPVSYSNLNVGSHMFYLRVRDVAGNTAETNFMWTIGSSSAPTPTPTPTPPPGTSADEGTIIFRETFANGSRLSEVWGEPAPTVVNDSTASDGRSLQYQWRSGFENYNGGFVLVPGTYRKIHVRIRYKQGANANNNGIQKIIRIRANANGNERAVGTINAQYGQWLFYGDDFGNFANHFQFASTVATHGPNTFRGQWRYLEFMLDYTNLNQQKAKLWVDGTLVLDTTVNLNSPIYSTVNLNGIMLLGTFNSPADTRTDWIDDVVVSTGYIGVN